MVWAAVLVALLVVDSVEVSAEASLADQGRRLVTVAEVSRSNQSSVERTGTKRIEGPNHFARDCQAQAMKCYACGK